VSARPAVDVVAVDLYEQGLKRALAGTSAPAALRVVCENGEELPLALERYVGPLAPEDEHALKRSVGPVLDVGCGPGRHVLALARRGVVAVGVDISPKAVRMARRRGAAVIEASIFDRLPGAGRWGSALLLDGNIGIGGCPAELLARAGALLCPTGIVVVEIDPPGMPAIEVRVRLESEDAVSEWFPWARLGVDDLGGVARAGGFEVTECWQAGARWFAVLAAS
jgi:SAM-dependent methyltransferase